MTNTSHILGAVFSLIVFGAIFWNLRAGRMKERYAFWWILIGLTIVVFSVFPGLLEWLSKVLGITIPLNLGLFAGGIVMLLISLQYAVDLSKYADRERRLTEEITLLEHRVSQLESQD